MRAPCSIEGCDHPSHGRGWCKTHYGRWLRLGSPHLPTQEERFWAKVDRGGPNECWLWKGAKRRAHNGFYGSCWAGNDTEPAHRFAYKALVGEIPDGLQLDHLCRTPLCVNPAHLEPVTRKENILRGTSPQARNARKDACLRGHAFTPSNTYVTPRGGRECRTCRKMLRATATPEQQQAVKQALIDSDWTPKQEAMQA